MKIILVLIILLLSSCSFEKNKNNINFSKDMSLNEFKLNLKKYAKESTYPNLND